MQIWRYPELLKLGRMDVGEVGLEVSVAELLDDEGDGCRAGGNGVL